MEKVRTDTPATLKTPAEWQLTFIKGIAINVNIIAGGVVLLCLKEFGVIDWLLARFY